MDSRVRGRAEPCESWGETQKKGGGRARRRPRLERGRTTYEVGEYFWMSITSIKEKKRRDMGARECRWWKRPCVVGWKFETRGMKRGRREKKKKQERDPGGPRGKIKPDP